MKVDVARVAEYRRRHNPIWPELEAVLRTHGVSSYSIFLDADTGALFAYAEIEDPLMWESIATTDVCQRWWRHMSPLMEVNADHSPKTKSLEEVFHIDAG